jgi:hypothetical protein
VKVTETRREESGHPALAVAYGPRSVPIMQILEAAADRCELLWLFDQTLGDIADMFHDAIRAAWGAVTTVGRTNHCIGGGLYSVDADADAARGVSRHRPTTGIGAATRSPTSCGICATTTIMSAPTATGWSNAVR